MYNYNAAMMIVIHLFIMLTGLTLLYYASFRLRGWLCGIALVIGIVLTAAGVNLLVNVN